MKYTGLAVFAFIFGTQYPCAAQTSTDTEHLVTGQLMFDEQPVEFAHIFVAETLENVKADGAAISDSSGYFEIQLRKYDVYPVNLFLLIHHVSFMNKNIGFSIEEEEIETIDLGRIELEPGVDMLPEVTVTAIREHIRREGNKLVYTIAENPTFRGQLLETVFSQLPGIQVTPDGDLLLMGSGGITVMINGRERHLTGRELTDLLQGYSADMVESIEISTSPTAEFAADQERVININLRDDKAGLTSVNTLTTGHGEKPRLNATSSNFYTTPKFQAFLNPQYINRQTIEYSTLRRNRSLPDAGRIFQDNEIRIKNESWGLLGDFTYDLNSSFTFNGSVKLDVLDEEIPRTGESRYLNTDHQTDLHLLTDNITRNRLRSLLLGFGGDYGSLLSIQYNRASYQIDSDQINRSETTPFNPSHQFGFSMDSNSKINFDIAEADLQPNIHSDIRFKTGLRYSSIRYASDIDFTLESDNAEWVLELLDFNRYRYRETNIGLYGSIDFQSENWSVNTGLRAERTSVQNSTDNSNGNLIDDTYLHWFPNINLFRTISAHHNVGVNFVRRINRPNYNSVNPTIFVLDPDSYLQGNILLQPQLSEIYEFVYIWRNNYLLSLSYQRIHDYIVQTPSQAGNLLRLQPTNFDLKTSANAYFSIPLRISRFWDLRGEFSFVDARFKKRFENEEIIRTSRSYFISTHHNFHLPGNLLLNITFFYNSPEIDGLYKTRQRYSLSSSIRKSLLDNRLNVRLSMNDLLNSYNIHNRVRDLNQNLVIDQNLDNRFVSFSISYSFNKGREARQRTSRFDNDEFRRAEH
ncbi:outer membrane beta-barrel family protein [Rhodohalobacter halophilus]|uniref:outer membrane beta-barrel family protein n=1 Tax=Rhodohalobacter halophilus TaxID=1812810 RepID=UPI00159EFCE7|nr:outer membrane beta-barrel family protein [Rhodohalobacter halophilus]